MGIKDLKAGPRHGSAASRLLGLRVRIRRIHGCLSFVSVTCCQVEVSETGWSLVQRNPTNCDVSECEHEASLMRRTWPNRGSCTMEGREREKFLKEGSHCPYKETFLAFVWIVWQKKGQSAQQEIKPFLAITVWGSHMQLFINFSY